MLACVVVAGAALIGARLRPRDRRAVSKETTTSTTRSAARTTPTVTNRPVTQYAETAATRLPAPLEDPAAAAVGGGALLAGGLDAADTSSSDVIALSATGGRVIGSLPSARHDAAGAALDGALYVFGGGDAVGQLDAIVRVDPSGVATTVGTLPTASSDSSAAVVGGTAYIVGGYTGTQWLDSIVAYSPGSTARVVAHLPTPLRYAAVGAIAGRIVIAGGSTPSARATSSVYVFDPRRLTVDRLRDLPAALTHASAVGAGREVLVAGGQDSQRNAVGTLTAIDPTAHRVRAAGTLLEPRSDAGLVNVGNRVWMIGGHGAAGVLDSVSSLGASVRSNVYAHDGANALSAVARTARALVYVPNSESNTVDVIDQQTMRIVGHFAVGELPQHVTPSWDLRTLYVDNDRGNSLTPIDPVTGQPGSPLPVTDPYNLYFTPDGRFAIVVAEARQELDFRDAHSMRLVHSVGVPCRGIDHMDFTADGRYALASCEFSGNLVVIDVANQSVTRTIELPRSSARPQDVKLAPDGSVFYVADMINGGVWEVDARTFAVVGFVVTGRGAHGIYPSRDARYLYVSNRDEGTISVVDAGSRSVVNTWTIPGGSPDMGGVSADGTVLWLSGRYHSEVYAISTVTGQLLARIPVGRGPHGLCVWPQPGRYSLGHTGVMR